MLWLLPFFVSCRVLSTLHLSRASIMVEALWWCSFPFHSLDLQARGGALKKPTFPAFKCHDKVHQGWARNFKLRFNYSTDPQLLAFKHTPVNQVGCIWMIMRAALYSVCGKQTMDCWDARMHLREQGLVVCIWEPCFIFHGTWIFISVSLRLSISTDLIKCLKKVWCPFKQHVNPCSTTIPLLLFLC